MDFMLYGWRSVSSSGATLLQLLETERHCWITIYNILSRAFSQEPGKQNAKFLETVQSFVTAHTRLKRTNHRSERNVSITMSLPPRIYDRGTAIVGSRCHVFAYRHGVWRRGLSACSTS